MSTETVRIETAAARRIAAAAAAREIADRAVVSSRAAADRSREAREALQRRRELARAARARLATLQAGSTARVARSATPAGPERRAAPGVETPGSNSPMSGSKGPIAGIPQGDAREARHAAKVRTVSA